jgi:FAD/FMN-containing dehydrogenase/Fe-S oxidoreductase
MDTSRLEQLGKQLEGDLSFDEVTRILYATDASVYREMPLAVARPKNAEDIRKLVLFAGREKVSLIPRAAGTSLAGQCVGSGIVVDISKYMTGILEVNQEEQWVRVQPGVVLDELVKYLSSFSLFFGPDTSTSNRCMIGGMVGNNACGGNALIYGSTREHTLEIKAILSDGSEAHFGPLTKKEFEEKCGLRNLEGSIYRNAREILSDRVNRRQLLDNYPERTNRRRNTGYAVDLLLDAEPFVEEGERFNFCKLLTGSEGTLAFFTELKMRCVPLPPREKAIVVTHLTELNDAFQANLVALKHNPVAVELMDKTILDRTADNREQQKNRFFLQGDPGALLIAEFHRDTKEEIEKTAEELISDLKKNGFGYHYPVVWGADIKKVWALRKAGLGVLSNIPGDAKPVSVVEDTAVSPQFLPDYIKDFQEMIAGLGLKGVYYAHIGTGELHLRPLLSLKDPKDVVLFRSIATETAKLVKKYRGSLSGEHGIGRVRGEFLPFMIGEHCYNLLRRIKKTWDPDTIFNPGKIIDTPPMDSCFRYEPGKPTREFKTYFNYDKTLGMMRSIEQCNGSGDCRKSHIIGGTMCPSYMATRDEQHVTRGRANVLREILTHSTKANPFDHKEIYQVMDLCLSCKACKSECPSNVDIARLKAEFLQHYYESNPIPLRTLMIANNHYFHMMGSLMPGLTNFMFRNMTWFTKWLGFAEQRGIPPLYKTTLAAWHRKQPAVAGLKRKVYLFNDEFTNYLDTEIGITAIRLLNRLGYEVVIPQHAVSGRAYLSKGMLKKAGQLAMENVSMLKDIVTEDMPLLGVEPSCILSFRDEYPELVEPRMVEDAKRLAKNALMVDEFLAREIDKGNITKEQFTKDKREVKLHGQCLQKAVASTMPTKKLLGFPENYSVEEFNTGCCGMAGAFGYEAEHYEISMKIGEMVLFPSVRGSAEDAIICAPGTSCRKHIKDGTGRRALHPVEVLYNALA